MSTRRQWLGATMKGVGGWALAGGSGGLRFAADGGPDDGGRSAGQDGRVHPYLHYDVFTDRPLTGNQLAVFLDPVGLSSEQMQDIARELNFSEIAFTFAAREPQHLARVRIFGRSREMQFAGHPVIGTAFALAHAEKIRPGVTEAVLELGLGPTQITLEWDGERLAFAWMSQQQPVFGPTIDDAAGLAEGLGLDVEALRDAGPPPQEVSTGNAFLMVPLATRSDVDRVAVQRTAMEAVFRDAGMRQRGLYVFSLEPGPDGGTAYARMVGLSGFEDPATGSAAGPLGCYLVRHRLVAATDADATTCVQGVAMQRPSRIHIRIGTRGDEITTVHVGGTSALVGEGTIRTVSGG